VEKPEFGKQSNLLRESETRLRYTTPEVTPAADDVVDDIAGRCSLHGKSPRDLIADQTKGRVSARFVADNVDESAGLVPRLSEVTNHHPNAPRHNQGRFRLTVVDADQDVTLIVGATATQYHTAVMVIHPSDAQPIPRQHGVGRPLPGIYSEVSHSRGLQGTVPSV
jgi:hypothetical protein